MEICEVIKFTFHFGSVHYAVIHSETSSYKDVFQWSFCYFAVHTHNRWNLWHNRHSFTELMHACICLLCATCAHSYYIININTLICAYVCKHCSEYAPIWHCMFDIVYVCAAASIDCVISYSLIITITFKHVKLQKQHLLRGCGPSDAIIPPPYHLTP